MLSLQDEESEVHPVGPDRVRFELAVDVRRCCDCVRGEGDGEGEFGWFYVMIACANRCFTDRE